jgi:hypothetical protein
VSAYKRDRDIENKQPKVTSHTPRKTGTNSRRREIIKIKAKITEIEKNDTNYQ